MYLYIYDMESVSMNSFAMRDVVKYVDKTINVRKRLGWVLHYHFAIIGNIRVSKTGHDYNSMGRFLILTH